MSEEVAEKQRWGLNQEEELRRKLPWGADHRMA
jgi:hypothetical protein